LLLAHAELPRGAFGALLVPRCIRIELERPPHDLHIPGMRELGQRALETPLPEVAPGAHDVRPDLYLHPILRLSADPPRLGPLLVQSRPDVAEVVLSFVQCVVSHPGQVPLGWLRKVVDASPQELIR